MDGWLDAAGARVRLEVCERATRLFVVDMTELRDADPDGVAAIQRLTRSSSAVAGASPYLELLISRRKM